MELIEAIEIEAPAADTWASVAGVRAWPLWTASMRAVEPVNGAALALGRRYVVRQPRSPRLTWTVTDLRDGRSFVWETRSPGLHAVAEHVVTSDGPDASTLVLAFRTNGVMAALMAPLMRRRARRFLQLEAAGMKRAAEARVTAREAARAAGRRAATDHARAAATPVAVGAA